MKHFPYCSGMGPVPRGGNRVNLEGVVLGLALAFASYRGFLLASQNFSDASASQGSLVFYPVWSLALTFGAGVSALFVLVLAWAGTRHVSSGALLCSVVLVSFVAGILTSHGVFCLDKTNALLFAKREPPPEIAI